MFSRSRTALAALVCTAACAASASAAEPETAKAADIPAHEAEIQMEYGHHHFFRDRYIDDYTIHYFQRFKKNGTMSLYKGATVEWGTGHTHRDGRDRSSKAFGLGPSFMIRWQNPIGGKNSKWAAGIDGKGSLLVYNHAFPAQGRAYGFQWAIGPRIAYHINQNSDISLAWQFKHNSNGFKSHNPGYNTAGYSLAYTYRY